MTRNHRIQYLVSLLVSVLLAMGVGALIMVCTGHSPLEGYSALIKGALGSNRVIGNTLYKSTQLCITGLATAVASQAGIFNVGGEGQMFLGALASAYVGTLLTGVSPIIAIPVCLLASIAAGALYALIPAVLKVKLKINEVITTIMMNTIAIKFCDYMSTGPLKDPSITKGTAKLVKDFTFSKLIPGSNLTESIFYIAVISLAVWYLMSRTTTGYEMKLTGQNERFARFAGLKASTLGILGMLISGAMCGMLGMFEIFGVAGRFRPDFSNEFYFDGMLVAMIMRYKPLGIVLMSFFFGVLMTGSTAMQRMGIPSELVMIIQSIIIFFMAAEEGFLSSLRLRQVRKAAAVSVRKEADHV